MKETDAAYLAGFIDGEGSIGLRTSHSKDNRTPSYVPRLRITNTNYEVLKWVEVTTGMGMVRKVKPASTSNYQAYEWYVSGSKMKWLLEELIPHLKIKRYQAEIVLEFLKTVQPSENGGFKKLPSNVIEIRNHLRLKLDEQRNVGLIRTKVVCGTHNLP
jgi:hypothetical protein